MKIHVLLYVITWHACKRECHTNLEKHQFGTVIQTDLSFDKDSQDHQISVGQWSALGYSGRMRQVFGAKNKINKLVLTVLLPFLVIKLWCTPLLWKIDRSFLDRNTMMALLLWILNNNVKNISNKLSSIVLHVGFYNVKAETITQHHTLSMIDCMWDLWSMSP